MAKLVFGKGFSLVFAILVLIPGCTKRPAARETLKQRAYVWQRQWTFAVSDAVIASDMRLDGVVALGAELQWNGTTPFVTRTNIDWNALRRCKSCGVAIRIAPVAALEGVEDRLLEVAAAELRRLFDDAKNAAAKVTELQVDFDCPPNDLPAYSRWVGSLRKAVTPSRLVITTLPAWLDSAAFSKLIANCDGYVLQVHSVPLREQAADWKICDPALARKWVMTAASFKKPFAVALPTYRCIAGYNPAGKLLGITMDSVQGRWPPNTRIHEIAADADELANLVREWQNHRPAELREIFWYRLPAEGDARNWRFATLASVVNGIRPRRAVDVVREGTNPVDLAIRNNGDVDERFQFKLIVSSDEPATAGDALTGCSIDMQQSESTFATAAGEVLQLRPGETRSIGWLRFASPANLHFRLVRH